LYFYFFLDLSTFHLFNYFIQGTLKHHSQSFSVSSKVFIIFGLIISIGQNFGASGCLLFRNECTIKILFIIPYCGAANQIHFKLINSFFKFLTNSFNYVVLKLSISKDFSLNNLFHSVKIFIVIFYNNKI